MERLSEILRRSAASETGSSAGPTAISSNAEPAAPPCSTCNGAGYLACDAPFGHPDFGRLVPCECLEIARQEERIRLLRAHSNLAALGRFTFESLSVRGRSNNPANQERFTRAFEAARRFARGPEGWLVLAGPSGSGKTHLAAAIGNDRLAHAEPAIFMVVPDLLDHVRATFSPTSEVTYDNLFDSLRTTPLLILDDLGAQVTTPWSEEKLNQLINHRYSARLPTVVTLCLPLIALSERLRTRLTDGSLSQVHTLEEEELSRGGGRDDPLGSPALAEMTLQRFDRRRLELDAEKRRNLERAYQHAVDFAREPVGWLVYYGDHGCGKTHLAAAIAHERRRLGHPAKFEFVPDLLDHLRSTFRPDSGQSYDALFEEVRNSPLLVLDDLGTQSATPWVWEKLRQLFNHRYTYRLPTVITSSCPVAEMDAWIASRLTDPRFSTSWEITASDYRGGAGQKPARQDAPPPRRERSQLRSRS